MFNGLSSTGILAGDKYGVAPSAFRTDIPRGVSVGSNALGSGPVESTVLAYPHAKSGLVEWAEALGGRHTVALLIAEYEGDGPVRAVLIDGVEVKSEILQNCLK